MESTLGKILGIFLGAIVIIAGIVVLTNYVTDVYDTSSIKQLNTSAYNASTAAKNAATIAGKANETASTASSNAEQALRRIGEIEQQLVNTSAPTASSACAATATTPSEYNISLAEIEGLETEYATLMKDAKASLTDAKNAVEDSDIDDGKDARKKAKAIWDPSDESGSLDDLKESVDNYAPKNESLFLRKQELINKIDSDDSKSVKDYVTKAIDKVDQLEKNQAETEKNAQPKTVYIVQQGNSTPNAANLAGLTGY